MAGGKQWSRKALAVGPCTATYSADREDTAWVSRELCVPTGLRHVFPLLSSAVPYHLQGVLEGRVVHILYTPARGVCNIDVPLGIANSCPQDAAAPTCHFMADAVLQKQPLLLPVLPL